MLVVAVFQFMKARGQRHGAYTTPAGARRMREFNASGGIGPSAASRYAAYRDQVRELGRSSDGAFPNRAVRRPARMAPMSMASRPPPIINEEEHGDDYDDDHLD